MRWLLTSLLALWPLAAPAAPVTWVYGGVISDVFTQSGPASPPSLGVLSSLGVSVGAAFQGSLTFESTSWDGDPAVDFASYGGAVIGMVAQIGTLSIQRQSFDTIVLNLGHVPNYYFATVIASIAPNPWGPTGHVLSLELLDSDGDAFPTDALPLVPPDLGLLDPHDPQLARTLGLVSGLHVVLNADGQQVEVTGELLTLELPEPGLGGLVALGALCVWARRRLASAAN